MQLEFGRVSSRLEDLSLILYFLKKQLSDIKIKFCPILDKSVKILYELVDLIKLLG